MSVGYRPGFWASKYRKLGSRERDQVNQRTNQIFANRTGVRRKLDPRHDRLLCDTWLRIRDEVMSGSHRTSSVSVINRAAGYTSRMAGSIASAAEFMSGSLQGATASGTPWISIARAEHRKGVKEIEGKKHNPDIMKYIRSCPDLYATENKTRYTEREGEEGVKWCSAFVNWCMKQAGIAGTNSARALSWVDWGERCPEPKAGAVVVTKGTKYRHVAFVDEVRGELKMLGGNQCQANGKGGYNQVSYRPINENIVVAYRMPIR